jgi:hypothetical protein
LKVINAYILNGIIKINIFAMDGMVVETPPRKRPRSETPASSSSSRHINKRCRPDTLGSPSPKAVHFDPIHLEKDKILESDVPESPIVQRKATAPLSVSFASIPPRTPMTEINDPLAKLNLKASAQKKNLATPVASKSNSEGIKSVKKSARKTPGSAKSNKAQPFRIKVSLPSVLILRIVFGYVADRSSPNSNPNRHLPSSFLSYLLACGIDSEVTLDASQ